jgi:hypothetical protein
MPKVLGSHQAVAHERSISVRVAISEKTATSIVLHEKTKNKENRTFKDGRHH